MANEITAPDKYQELLSHYIELLSTVPDMETNERDSLYSEIEEMVKRLRDESSVKIKECQDALSCADELEVRVYDLKNSEKKRKFIPTAPANGIIDAEEAKTSHFARGLNFYKLFIILFVGSLLGVIIELLWCFITNGYIESRSGLVYGPFNLLYGAGAVLLTVTLYRYRNKSRLISFFGGMIVGSVLEYGCSFFQELLTGTRSWDYSAIPFNINGRICLLYSVFWGILGALWIKNLYPRFAKVILGIPDKPGIIIIWILTAFMVLNSAVTVLSLWRWTERKAGNEATNGFEQLIDDRFNNERMESIFANMTDSETITMEDDA